MENSEKADLLRLQIEAFMRAAGSWAAEDYPELSTDEGVMAFVRNLRQEKRGASTKENDAEVWGN